MDASPSPRPFPSFLSPPSLPRSARIARLRSNPSDQSTSSFPPSRSRARVSRGEASTPRDDPDCAQSNLSRNAAASCRNRVAPAKVSSSHALRSVRALTTRDAKESRFSVSVSPKSVGAGASALEGVTTRARAANTRQPRANPSDLRLRRRLSSPSRRAVPHPPRRARPGARA